jgi:hypothetical protein
MHVPNPDAASNSTLPAAYEPPAIVVLGSVAAITLSSQSGSISDFKGRTNKH